MNEKIMTAATVVAGSGTTYMGFNQEQWGIIALVVGIAATILTFVGTMWFNAQKLKIRLRESDAKIAALRNSCKMCEVDG